MYVLEGIFVEMEGVILSIFFEKMFRFYKYIEIRNIKRKGIVILSRNKYKIIL